MSGLLQDGNARTVWVGLAHVTNRAEERQMSNVFPEPGRIGEFSKRELFAAMAMQGFIAGDATRGTTQSSRFKGNVGAALEYADALIEALEKPRSDK
jgi:hypothetical protein